MYKSYCCIPEFSPGDLNKWFFVLILFLSACAPVATEPAVTELPPSATATQTTVPTATNLPPTATPVPTPTLPPMTDFMKGLVYFPAGWGGDQRPETDWILKNIVVPTGANWIRLHVGCYQDGIESTQVYCKPEEGLSDEAYLHLVKTAHSLGLRVMSEHMIDSSGWADHWAGDIGKGYNEQQWAEWFDSFGKTILHYAQMAETAGTDYLIISSELESTTRREKEWRELIAKVREVYHGKISMSYSEESSLQSVQFWDALDAITVHPYYLDLPGVTDPTVEQLTRAFIPRADRLEALSKKWDKPILISEIGFPSIHTITQNYNNGNRPNPVDLQEQNDLFQALFETFYEKDWLIGIFCYAISGSNYNAEPWDISLNYIGKPAENVIRSFYGAPPFPTPTPVAPPASDLKTVEVIYDDKLNPPWTNYQGDTVYILFDQSDISVSGNAIKATLPFWWSIDFSNDTVDWSRKYQWLEFDMYVEPQDMPKGFSMDMTLRDTAYLSSIYSVGLIQGQFISGGKIQPGTWQHVQIPLDVFGPLLSHYPTFIISRSHFGENKPLILYLDNVILRGK